MRKWMIAAGAALALLSAAGLVLYLQPFPPLGYGDAREDEIVRDCEVICPELVPIPAGRFVMGAHSRREAIFAALGLPHAPLREITVERPFLIGRFEVTFAQWDACVADGGCNNYSPSDEGWGRADRPVIHVSWNDAQAYLAWLSAKTGRAYRLPTDAEWEYAARAGNGADYPWGRGADRDYANYGGPACPPCTGVAEGADQWVNTAPVGSFPPNRFGLHDVSANVYEWVADCHIEVLPREAATAAAVRTEDCAEHPMRGAAWYSNPERVTSHYRAHNPPDYKDFVIGFRVARDL